MLRSAPSLTDQIYDAIVADICDGRIGPGTHLVQERLADRFSVSRQPIQQAMARLRADGVVEELGRRGLFVAPLDPQRLRQHYGIRAALDGWATRTATERLSADRAAAKAFVEQGRAILAAGQAAVAAGEFARQVQHDEAFHFLLYGASGNPMAATSAEPHWRFLRRAMSEVLRKAEAPSEIWRQHAEIFEAVAAGDAAAAEALAVAHVERAAVRLADQLERAQGEQRTGNEQSLGGETRRGRLSA